MVRDPHRTGACYSNRRCRRPECVAKHAAKIKRQRLARARRGVPAGVPHGVYTTYGNWACRCTPCCDAMADYQREYRVRHLG